MARRRHQRGCVILKGQVWYGKYRDDVVEQDGTVTRVQRRTPLGTKREYPTKRLAERKLEQILCRINAVEYRPGRVATLAEFAERWKVEIVTKYKPSTKCSAGSHVNSHILPYLGKLRMDAIGAENQQAFVTHLADQVSYKSVLNILSTLSSMLTTAKNWGYVCEGVDQHKLVLPGRGIRKDAACFTADEVRNILRIAEDPWRLMFACAALLGLRAGEILGLRVEDVDLQTRTLNIKQGAWRGKLQTAKNTASEAALPIPAALEGFFREYLKTWKPNPLGLLFCNRNARAYTSQKIVEYHLWPLLDALKIKRAGFHAFRHAHATLLLEGGASPKVAQRQLRHSDARVTLGIYAHLVEGTHREAVEKLASFLVPIGPNEEEVPSRIQ
ncbi:MAG: tyrosine-type recombinase/integrase [Candidatus Acidiferrum sp.]